MMQARLNAQNVGARKWSNSLPSSRQKLQGRVDLLEKGLRNSLLLICSSFNLYFIRFMTSERIFSDPSAIGYVGIFWNVPYPKP